MLLNDIQIRSWLLFCLKKSINTKKTLLENWSDSFCLSEGAIFFIIIYLFKILKITIQIFPQEISATSCTSAASVTKTPVMSPFPVFTESESPECSLLSPLPNVVLKRQFPCCDNLKKIIPANTNIYNAVII